jgi:amidase
VQAADSGWKDKTFSSGFPAVDFRGLAGEGNLVTQLWTMAACDLARLVADRDVSAREVVQAHLDRIRLVNPALNAIAVILGAQALEAADAADAALRRGGQPGPLCGVPMTVKENIDVAGSATTLGIAALRNAVARSDAPHVGELRSAGAIAVGRTNMPELGMRWHTASALRGATRNPWSASHTPGGSSGGDAAAVASGMVPLGMGNDGAGSLRWPAACCGVAALKPSLGRVSQGGGHEPPQPSPFAFQLMAVNGPIARHVRDPAARVRAHVRAFWRRPLVLPRSADRPARAAAGAGVGHRRSGRRA